LWQQHNSCLSNDQITRFQADEGPENPNMAKNSCTFALEKIQLFSTIHLKLAKKSKKLSNYFQQQKIEILHQTAPNTVCIDIA
jgi:hypothetical protein